MRGLKRLQPEADRYERAPLGLLQSLVEVEKAEGAKDRSASALWWQLKGIFFLRNFS